MAADKKALSDVFIRKVAPTDRRQEIPDGGAPGLYLVVQTSGAKSWAVRYSRAGKVQKSTLGRYPAMTLAEARKQAAALSVAVDGGADPQAEKKAAKADAKREAVAAQTVNMVADEFLTRHVDEKAGKRWSDETRRILDHDIRPAIGAKAVSEVGRADINAMLDAVADRGAPIAANRALAVARKLFRWARSRDYVDRDPTEGVAKPGDETKRERVLNDGELAAVWRAADGLGYPFGPIVRLLILTGGRRDEVGAMTWTEVDVNARTWTLPAERAKNGQAHEIPLSDSAVAILESLPRVEPKRDEKTGKPGPAYVFTVTGRTPVSGWSRSKTTLDAAITNAARKEDPDATPMPDWRVHDMRRTVATGLARIGVALPVVERILNHVSGSFGGVQGVYQKFAFADEKRDALDRWSARVAEIVKSRGT